MRLIASTLRESRLKRDPLVPPLRPIFPYFPLSAILVSVNRCENVSHCLTPIPVYPLHPEERLAVFNDKLLITPATPKTPAVYDYFFRSAL